MSFRSMVGVLALAAALALLGPVAGAADDDWRMFRGDAARTGSPFDQAQGGTGAVVWKVALVNESESSPAVARGRVFVGSSDGNLTALWAANGTKNWTYDMTVRVTASPIVVEAAIPEPLRGGFRWAKDGTGDLAIIGDESGTLHAVKAFDGRLWWTYATDGLLVGGAAEEAGRVFVASSDGVVHAVTTAGGDALWTFETGGEIAGSVVVADGLVVVGSLDERVYALAAATGDLVWSFDAGARVGASPAVAHGLVIVGDRDGRVHGLDADDGRSRWTYETGAAVFGSAAVRGGRVFVPSLDEYVHALDVDDGDLAWKARAKPTSSPAALGGAVVVGAVGAVVALDPANGAELWRAAANGRFDSSPAVVNGTLYVASSRIGLKQGADDHHVYALNAGAAFPLPAGGDAPAFGDDGTGDGGGDDAPPSNGDGDGSAPPSSDEGDGKGSGEENGLPLPAAALAAAALGGVAAARRAARRGPPRPRRRRGSP